MGLLVRTAGEVTHVDPGGLFFYIDDGSHVRDGSGHVGVQVYYGNTAGAFAPPAAGERVVVTGASGLRTVAGKYARLIRPRSQTDVVEL